MTRCQYGRLHGHVDVRRQGVLTEDRNDCACMNVSESLFENEDDRAC